MTEQTAAGIQVRAGDHGSQGVEDVVLGLGCHGRGQDAFSGAGDIGTKF